MNKYVQIIVISLALLVIVGCQVNQDHGQDQDQDQVTETLPDTGEAEQLTIYTTIYPLAFIAETIGGDFVQVESILPAGSDAHSFEPTSKLMVEIAEADLFIFNDEVSESYAHTIKDALINEQVEFLEASAGLDKINYDHDHDHEDDEHGYDHGDLDPHVWISPKLMNELAENILMTLIEQMPEQQDYFNNHFDQLSNRLLDLDAAFTEMIEQARHNKILVTHAAFGYWERDYNIEQIAVTGISATEEPSQRQLTQLLDEIEALELNYILFEQNIQPRVAEVIQAESGLEQLLIHNLAVLTTEDIENGDDYFSLMERNIAVLTQALN